MLVTYVFHIWLYFILTKRSRDIEYKNYIATHKLDVLCLSEAYLDSSISNNDDNLEISGYDLFRTDHLSNTKRDGVCIYYRNALPLKTLNI